MYVDMYSFAGRILLWLPFAAVRLEALLGPSYLPTKCRCSGGVGCCLRRCYRAKASRSSRRQPGTPSRDACCQQLAPAEGGSIGSTDCCDSGV